MKIVIISDTHNLHNLINLPSGDVLIHCGDLCNSGSIRDVVGFNIWIGKQDFKHKLVIPGNHDRVFETDYALAKDVLDNATLLLDSSVTIEGIKFYGSPWQPAFCNWAFNVPRGLELKEKWDNIPLDTDVLITHGPPHGMLDTVPGDGSVGCEELLLAVERVQPKLHCFGHIHGGYGIDKRADTVFVNASSCTERYIAANKPIIIGV